MPYRQNPKNSREVQKKVKNRWVHEQTCKSASAAKRAIKLLYGIEGGEWKPTGKKKRGKSK